MRAIIRARFAGILPRKLKFQGLMTKLNHAEPFTPDEMPDEMFAQAAETPAYPPVMMELVRVLAAHPGGLRRWSVMHTIRAERDKTGREIPQKLEDDIERAFRHYCAGDKSGICTDEEALFYRPKGKAGEVWAAYPERIKGLLAENDNEL